MSTALSFITFITEAKRLILDAALMLASRPWLCPSGTVSGMDAAYEPPGMDSRRVPEGHSQGRQALSLTLHVKELDLSPTRYIQTLALALLVLATSSQLEAQETSTSPVVLTSLAPVYELTKPLLEGTSIDLQLLPDSPRSMQTHPSLFIRQADRFADQFRRADALISIGKLWSADPLYISARQFNPRVVDIDATKPYSHELDGIAVASSPLSGQPAPWFWLSPGNVIRSLDIIGKELMALYPDAGAVIQANLAREQNRYRALKADAEARLLAVDDPQVYALAEEFVYLTGDLGLFVAGYFVKQDIDWTEADYGQLTRTLQDHGVEVVIHKWEPAAPIRAAVEAAGARLVVLDVLETSTDFAAGLQANLDLLLDAWQQH